MELKQEVVYRKAKKADYPAMIELIRQENQSRWECENESTEKHLGKILFYQYMMSCDTVIAATYRERVVGVIIAGKGKRAAPLLRLKKSFHYLLLKIRKEGRNNLKILNQIGELKEKLIKDAQKPQDAILFFYVHKNYRRNGIGTSLLNHLQEPERKELYVCADQKDNLLFMEKYGFAKMADAEEMMEVHRQRFRETVSLYIV